MLTKFGRLERQIYRERDSEAKKKKKEIDVTLDELIRYFKSKGCRKGSFLPIKKKRGNVQCNIELIRIH